MPGTRCSVALCNNSHRKTKHTGVMYHRFPKDPLIRKQWIHKCRKNAKINPNTSHICSQHFTEEDYSRNLQNELLGLPIVKRLNQTAVPSLNFGTPEPIKEASVSRKERVKKRESKKLVLELLQNAVLTEQNVVENVVDSEVPQQDCEGSDRTDVKIVKQKLEESLAAQTKLKERLKKQNLVVKTLRTQVKRERKINTALKKALTKNQTPLLLKQKKKSHLGQSDVK